MKILVLIGLVIFIVQSSFCTGSRSDNPNLNSTCKSDTFSHDSISRNNYEDRLDNCLFKIREGNQIDDNIVLFVIPTTDEEAVIFYSKDYIDSISNSFKNLNEIIRDSVLSGNRVFIKRYLKSGDFVDGYFAYQYFETIDVLQENKPNLFCEICNQFEQGEIERLEGYCTNACNQKD